MRAELLKISAATNGYLLYSVILKDALLVSLILILRIFRCPCCIFDQFAEVFLAT